MPNHHLALASGYVYEHQIVAEKILNRKLNKHEVVHHIDFDRTNNDENNLIIFHSQQDHASFHAQHCNCEILIKQDDGSYKVNNLNINLFCPVCGTIKDYRAKLCDKCRRINDRKVIRPSEEELKKKLIDNNGNFTKVAEFYGVTDNALRKWCKNYCMPYHSKDYRTIA